MKKYLLLSLFSTSSLFASENILEESVLNLSRISHQSEINKNFEEIKNLLQENLNGKTLKKLETERIRQEFNDAIISQEKTIESLRATVQSLNVEKELLQTRLEDLTIKNREIDSKNKVLTVKVEKGQEILEKHKAFIAEIIEKQNNLKTIITTSAGQQ